METDSVEPTQPECVCGKARCSRVLGLVSFGFLCFTGAVIVLFCLAGPSKEHMLLPIFCSLIFFFTGLGAVIVGMLALHDIRRAAGQLIGREMAVEGIKKGGLSSLAVLVSIALFLPAVQGSREAHRRTQCKNNLKQIGLALHEYHAMFGSFPPPATYDEDGRPLLSWRVLILPCLEQKQLFEQFRLDEPWDSPNNLPLADKMPEVYGCPSDDLPSNATGYVVAVGDETYFPPHGTVSYHDVKDGSSVTGMVGELRSSKIVWTKPEDLVFDDRFTQGGGFSSAHVGGWQMLMGDGTVRFVSENIDRKVYYAIMTIAGGEPVDEDDF